MGRFRRNRGHKRDTHRGRSTSMINIENVLGKVQLWSQPQLFLRFYGRFLFVRTESMLRVLAIDVTDDKSDPDNPDREPCTAYVKHTDDKPNADDRDCHVPFMTLREKNVGLATIKPSSRIMGTEVAPFQGALRVWNLKQWTVTINSDGGPVRWPEDEAIPLADLGVLSGSDID